ncbi:fimbrial protein [Escherichia coli]|uniref:fimbrial protein n=1 Tax=Escherichia coli TaxID=562 RepID=UPI000CFC31EE|nr:fimbrial protein [Escherichia coli]
MKGISDSVKLLLALVGGSFIFGIQPAGAVDINIKITGEIYIPPCIINGSDSEILVSFDKMSLYEVDGYKNAKTKTVSVSCDYYQGTPYIRIDGTMLSGAGNNVLKTTGANPSTLGIALYQGSDVNSAYPMNIGAGEQGKFGYKIMRGLKGQNASTGQFTFTAVPYKHGAGTLNAGTFSAIATMSISYL